MRRTDDKLKLINYFIVGMLIMAFITIFASAVSACPAGCTPEPPKPKPKTVYITKTVEGKSPNTNSNSNSNAKAEAESNATTGNQTQVVTVVQPPQKPIIVKLKRTITKHKTKKVTKKVFVYKPNRLLLLGGATKSKLDIKFDCCNLDIQRKYEPDFGLQYIRDFGRLSGSVAATMNKSMYLGLGINW